MSFIHRPIIVKRGIGKIRLSISLYILIYLKPNRGYVWEQRLKNWKVN